MPTITQWRTLNGTEKASVLPRLLEQPYIHAGGSLHVDEYHAVIDGVVYRFFVPATAPAVELDADSEIEVSWEVEIPEQGLEDQQRRSRHFDICRIGDQFADTLMAIDAPLEVRQELKNQIVAMQRLAMVLNTPGRGLSPSTLNRF